jgi:large subunit ribosomal protein L25
MEALALTAEARQICGTGSARALRKNGRVPATIYGAGKKPMSVSVEEKQITKLYRKPHFISTLIDLDIDGKHHKVLPKAVALDPITDIVMHVDFTFLNDKIQTMEVPIVFDGKDRSLGVKRGGFFNIVKRTVLLKCNVNSLPRNIMIDVSNMQIGQSLKSSNVKLPEGCEFIGKTNFVIASMIGKVGKEEVEEGAVSTENKE